MLKKLLLAILIALPVSMFAQKFGQVDIEAVITVMPEYTQAQTTMQESSTKYQEELQKLQDELQKKYTEFQQLSQDGTTPQSILERRMQEIQELDNKIQQFQNTAAQDLQRQQQQLMAPIEKKINDAITAVGDEGSFTYIFQKGMSLYTGKDVIDVTPQVKTKLGIQ